jgi:RNA polymerase sigma factor (sigma-70 family)
LEKKQKLNQYSDQELLNRYRKESDGYALGHLLERYTLLLLGVCMKYLKDAELAKDATQQIILKCITEVGKYEITYFKSWLYQVARNHCLMQLRQKNGKSVGLSESILLGENPLEEGNEAREREEKLVLLEACLPQLNEEQRVCVLKFYLEKKSYQTIAEETGYSLLQVKSYIQNGKRNLKLLMEKRKAGQHE